MLSDSLPAYDGLACLFGDLHNHCGISYGHGSAEEAFANARQRLDFCSVTGHAFWPDMPAPTPETQYIIDFHTEGFARLKRQWSRVVELTEESNVDGEFAAFLGFEMHCSAAGDYTVLYRDGRGDVLYCDAQPALLARIHDLRRRGVEAMAFPHHIGYPLGRRGIDWDAFDEDVSPVVEIISMHGCSERDESPRPFLHSMGPADHDGTMQAGLARGRTFGVIGSTDHHSAHPGSYGHGLTGVWAKGCSRRAVWDALLARRTCALTGDRIAVQFALNGAPMGSTLGPCRQRQIEIRAEGGGPIDYVDLVRNNELIRRWSPCDVPRPPGGETVRTKLLLEVGWGHRGRRFDWDVAFGVSAGRVLAVEPRFRGAEVVSPTEADPDRRISNFHSRWQRADERAVRFQTITFGNPNNFTPATQGVCLDAELPAEAIVWAELNGRRIDVPLRRLLDGPLAGSIGEIDSPAYRLARAPRAWEWRWSLEHAEARDTGGRDVYYVRVRQKNDQWAWSSPIFVA